MRGYLDLDVADRVIRSNGLGVARVRTEYDLAINAHAGLAEIAIFQNLWCAAIADAADINAIFVPPVPPVLPPVLPTFWLAWFHPWRPPVG